MTKCSSPGTIATELARPAVLGSVTAGVGSASRKPTRRLGESSEIADLYVYPLRDAANDVADETAAMDRGTCR